MEAIEFEKKQLLQQWRSSIVGMQRRDEALQNVQQALKEQDEAALAVESEIRGLQNSIKSEQERNEQLSALKDRNDKEMAHLNSGMTTIRQDRERLMESFNMLKRSMDHATEETHKMNLQIADAEHQHQVVERNVQTVSRDITAHLSKIDEEVSEQTTVDRASANSKKRIKKVREEIAQKEVETQNLHNEIARVTVDSLNTKAHNQMLRDRLKQLNDDLAEREKLIEQYEQEIRKRHHQIEKKQLYVDRLNREYDEKRTKLENEMGEADVAGPQEAKIKHLKKTIADMTKECDLMQKDWIQKQTQLLSISSETDRLRGLLNEQKNKKMVLEQKRIRIEGSLQAQQKEIKELENGMKHMRFAMDRMNGAIVKHDSQSKDISNNNFLLETEFVAKLKEIESQCLRVEEEVTRTKDEKTQMTQDILEAERQVLLWERKIALEKEMQEALDPNVGQAETAAMHKEIHRMELRLDQLKRRQEQMIVEMERAIHKRDAIALKYEPKAKKDKGATTAANLKRQVQSLKNNLRLCTQANGDIEQKISAAEADLEQLTKTIESSNEECARLEQEGDALRSDVQVATVEQRRKFDELVRYQRTAKRLDEFSMGTGPPPPPNARAQFAEQVAMKQKTADVLKVLSDAFPQIQQLWDQFYQWQQVEPGF
jgi:chromosome segregation ATPase